MTSTVRLCGPSAAMVLAAVCMPALAAAQAAAASWGVASLLLVVPALWLAVGCGLCCACALTSRLLLPPLSPNRPIKLFSFAFARWWLVGAQTFPQKALPLQADRSHAPCNGMPQLTLPRRNA